jgi:hypothetical protein
MMPKMSKTLALQLGAAFATALASAAMAAPPQPPPEAYTACTSKAAGDTCSVTFHEHTMSGTCSAIEEKLACKPDHPPPHGGAGGPHGPPPEAKAACTSKAAGAACSVTFPDGTMHSGACRTGPGGDDTTLACAPQ